MDEKWSEPKADDESAGQLENDDQLLARDSTGGGAGESAEAPRVENGDAAAAAAGSAIADGELRMLDPRFVTMERVSSWITAGIIALGSGFGTVVTALAVDEFWFAVTVACIWPTLIGLLFWWGYRYPKLFYAHARYRLEERGIEIRRGVWWRQVIDVPRSRVQHTDVTQGPLMRRYGIARLVVHTAGTENASVDLNGLAHPTALLIRDFLIRGGEADGT